MRPANQRHDRQSAGSVPADCLTAIAPTADETTRLGEAVGRAARPGDLILLRGQIGAGKTTFTQGLAKGLGHQTRVTSPSFTLANVYASKGAGPPLFHLDLWRIRSAEEALGIGLDEYLSADGVCVIEWPEIAENVLPGEYLRVRFEVIDDGRRIELCPIGNRSRILLDEVREALRDTITTVGGVRAPGD